METPRSPNIHVFSGPTIAPGDVHQILPGARVHPPVACRDLGRIAWRPGDVAAIVDGLFLQAPAVRHKEIISLLQRGVIVCGASSMGALRAAELCAHGMVGVGLVYRLYSLGVIDRDDEVAIAHAPLSEGCRPLSVALVTVRVAARHARRAGLIDVAHERHVVATASAMPFAARRWRSIAQAAEAAGGDTAQCAAFLDYCLRTDPDVKRDDARLLFRELASGTLFRRVRDVGVAIPWTHFQQVWDLEGRGETVGETFVSDRDALRCLQLVAAEFPAYYRRFCLQRIAADGFGVSPHTLDGALVDEVEERALHAARSHGIIPHVPRRALIHFDLAESDLSRDDLLTLLVRSYRHEPGAVPMAALIEQLGDLPAFAHARALAGRGRRHLELLAGQDDRFRQDHVTPSAVAGQLALLWQASYRPGAAQDRGFPSLRSVLKAARPLVPYLASADAHIPDLRLLHALPPPWRPRAQDRAARR